VPNPLVCPNINGTVLGSIAVAAARAGVTAVGTMDSSPTEAEVVALQQLLEFSAIDNVLSVNFLLVTASIATSAVLAVRCKVNGTDDYSDAGQLAAGTGDVLTITPNVPYRLTSAAAITRLMVCGVPSGVGGGNYDGCRLFLTSESYA
jgi:hypothetical protein